MVIWYVIHMPFHEMCDHSYVAVLLSRKLHHYVTVVLQIMTSYVLIGDYITQTYVLIGNYITQTQLQALMGLSKAQPGLDHVCFALLLGCI